MSSVTLAELLNTLESGATVLLPNVRAARQLRAAFNTRQRLQGRQAWEPARALSWAQWTHSLWKEMLLAGAEQRLLLNLSQEHLLWWQIVAEDAGAGVSRSVGSADSLAELAGSAWRLAADYNATQLLRRFASSHDSRIFTSWAEAFRARCRDAGVLSASLLDAALEEHARAGGLALPAPDGPAGCIELAGFVHLLPSQRSLLEALQQRGVAVRERSLEDAEGARSPRVSVAAPNEREELLLAVRWIRGFLEANRAANRAREQNVRVALLLPNPAERRAEIEGVFREILAPELQPVGSDLSSTPWEFSGGVALSSMAMITDALAILRWTEGALHRQRTAVSGSRTAMSRQSRSPGCGSCVTS